jgi:hypothetical protein
VREGKKKKKKKTASTIGTQRTTVNARFLFLPSPPDREKDDRTNKNSLRAIKREDRQP